MVFVWPERAPDGTTYRQAPDQAAAAQTDTRSDGQVLSGETIL
jgi:hypothetical protein